MFHVCLRASNILYMFGNAYFCIIRRTSTPPKTYVFFKNCVRVCEGRRAGGGVEPKLSSKSVVPLGLHTLNILWISILYFLKVKHNHSTTIQNTKKAYLFFSRSWSTSERESKELSMACYWWICALWILKMVGLCWINGALHNPAWEQHIPEYYVLKGLWKYGGSSNFTNIETMSDYTVCKMNINNKMKLFNRKLCVCLSNDDLWTLCCMNVPCFEQIMETHGTNLETFSSYWY